MRSSARVAEAVQKKARLSSALVVFVPAANGVGKRKPKGFHAVAELSERLIIDNEPFVRVRCRHPAPGDPEVVHLAWLSDDLQEALLDAARTGRPSAIVDESRLDKCANDVLG